MARNTLRRYYTIGEEGIIEWEVRPNDEKDLIYVSKATYQIFKDGVQLDTSEMPKIQIGEDKTTVNLPYKAVEKGEFLIRVFITAGPETRATEIIVQVED